MSIQERLQMIMKMHNLNASSFAEKIGVQRSNVSHILSGRNNPSLDFIQKTLAAFPRVNGDWLVSGRRIDNQATLPLERTNVENQSTKEIQEEASEKASGEQYVQTTKKIRKIIVFFEDGTFQETKPS